MSTVACPGCGHVGPATADGRCAHCGQVAAGSAPTLLIPSSAPAGDTVTVSPAGPSDGPTLTHTGGAGGPSVVPKRVASIPGYEIEAELGRGGMGVVYRARELNLKRPVALKVLLAGSHAGSRDLARFQAEATAAAAVRHPNVVQVYAVGQHGGLPFIALELLTGGSLDARLSAGPMAPADAARVVHGIARGVQAAHDQGVVHRDLKPANVLFGPDGDPKVADFGLAKLGDTGLTASHAVMGTPAYMAPEQARGDTRGAGPAADIWALGAILYECLAGRPPFRGQSAPETLRLVCETEPAPLRRADTRVPKDLETVALKCLEKDPARRYSSAGAVADDLARYLAGESVTARPRGRVVRVARWVGRYRGPVYGAVGAVLAAVVSLVVLSMIPGPSPPGPSPKAPTPPLDLVLIPPDAVAFATLRPDRLPDTSELIKIVGGLEGAKQDLPDRAAAERMVTDYTGLRPADIERMTITIRGDLDVGEGMVPDILILIRAKMPLTLKAIRDRLENLFGTMEAQDHRGHRLYAALSERTPFAVCQVAERDLVFGTIPAVRSAIDRLIEGPTAGPLGPAVAVAEEGHAVVVAARTADLYRLAVGVDARQIAGLPKPLAGLFDQLQHADLAIVVLNPLPPTADNPLPGVDLSARLRYLDKTKAARGLPAVRGAVEWLGTPDTKPAPTGLAALLPALRRAAREAAVRQEGTEVVVTLGPRWTAADLAAAGKPPTLTPEEQLHQIGLAMHVYESDHGHFPPPVIRAPDGRPLYSWRVELLPYLGEQQLYHNLDRTQPWDSERNKPLLAKAPRPYAIGPEPDVTAGQTRFQAAVGKGGIFDGSLVGFTDITDGTANTILVVEAGDPVHWAEPRDFAFEPGRPRPRLGGPGRETFLAVMADGSVKPIPRSIPSDALFALVTRSGGELVDWKTWTVSRRARKEK
jgi:hypothetical protein